MDPVALRYLYLDWNVSSSDAAAFNEKFAERMTDDYCVGDESWHEAYCKGINATFGAVSGRNTGFCGLEEPMQAGCASVVVNKTCVTWYEGRRLEDGVAEESVELEFRSVAATSIPGARRTDYDGCAADTTSVDALVVENGGGAVVGQLVGDGVAIVATAGDFDDAYLCLDLRTDIRAAAPCRPWP